MNSLFKILIDKILSEHTLDELSNKNLHDDIEKDYNKIVEEYKKQKDE